MSNCTSIRVPDNFKFDPYKFTKAILLPKYIIYVFFNNISQHFSFAFGKFSK